LEEERKAEKRREREKRKDFVRDIFLRSISDLWSWLMGYVLELSEGSIFGTITSTQGPINDGEEPLEKAVWRLISAESQQPLSDGYRHTVWLREAS